MQVSARTARRWILVCALTFPLSARAGKRYESMMVDRVDMTATLSEPLGLLSAGGSFFERDSLPGGRAVVREFHDGALEGEYYLSDKNALLGRSDLLLVLDEDFGRVYASIKIDYGAGRMGIGTRMLSRRSAGQAARPDKGRKSGSPDGFSLVRALKAPPKLIVAAGDYSLDGTLVAFSVAWSSGDWIQSEGGPQPPPGFGKGFFAAPGIDATLAAAAGLPLTLDPIRFETDPFKGLPEPSYPVDRDAALVYRDRGAIVDRAIKRGSRVERATLWFPPSEIERALLAAERRLSFSAGATR
jgi:hypothetical protein